VWRQLNVGLRYFSFKPIRPERREDAGNPFFFVNKELQGTCLIDKVRRNVCHPIGDEIEAVLWTKYSFAVSLVASGWPKNLRAQEVLLTNTTLHTKALAPFPP